MFFYYLLNIPFLSGISSCFLLMTSSTVILHLIKQLADAVCYFFVSLIAISYRPVHSISDSLGSLLPLPS